MSNNSARGIPSAGTIFEDPKQRGWSENMQENVEIGMGVRGDVRDQMLTWRKFIDLGFVVLKDNDLVKDISEQPAFKAQAVLTPGWHGMFAMVNPASMRTENIVVQSGEVISFAGAFQAVNTATNQSVTITVSGGLCSPDGVYQVVDPIGKKSVTMTITNGRILTVIG